jgi:hypothetical protein
VQEELLPEAFGQIDVLVLILRAASVGGRLDMYGIGGGRLTLKSVSYS